VALYGLSGVGKTQVALRFADDHREAYDYVFFVDASSLEVLQNDFRKLQMSMMDSNDSSNSIDKMINWLTLNAYQRWLLILDGAKRFRDIVPIISRLVRTGHIILTTLDASVGGHEFVQESLAVGPLSPAKSVELLFARASLNSPKPTDIEIAKKLLEEMGYLPLAIDSAGAYIRVQKKSVREYANLFHNVKFQKGILDHRPQASSYSRSVIDALELSFKEIDNRPEAHLLLSLLVFLDRAEVTQEFLRRGSTEQLIWGPSGNPAVVKPADNYVPEELVTLLTNDIKLDQAVAELISLSIITCISRKDEDRVFVLHPLYHQCAKLRMSKEQRRRYSAQALYFLAQAFPCDEYVLEKG
jgi:NB-ARC domain